MAVRENLPIPEMPDFSSELGGLNPDDPVHYAQMNAILTRLLTNDVFLEKLAAKMIEKSLISHVLDSTNASMVLGADQAPALTSLIDTERNRITQLNMDLAYKYKDLDCPYMDMSLDHSGKEAILYTANQVKVPMYMGYTYTLCTLPISCPEYHIMVLVDNGSFGFLGITNSVVTFEPYGRNFNVGDWIYICQPLILY